MKISESKSGDVVVLSFSGELMGGESAEEFQKYVYRMIENDSVNIVLDMSEVEWMNSAGLGMIMGALTTFRGSGGDLRLASVSERVARPIAVTRLDSVIQIYNSVDEAVKSFDEEE